MVQQQQQLFQRQVEDLALRRMHLVQLALLEEWTQQESAAALFRSQEQLQQ